jgi:glutathione S-transferase
MNGLTLVIGSKNGSPWSLRPWLLLRQTGLAFGEILIPLRRPDTAARIQAYSPSGKVPVLLAGDLRIWDSMAIGEFLAERDPGLWPADPRTRAFARSICAEMHSGFAALRTFLPMDFTARFGPPGKLLSPVAADIRRILAIWAECRLEHARAGPFLFGSFTIADAMFAPICSRFTTYAVALDPVARAYVAHMMSLPAMLEWGRAAAAEVTVADVGAPMDEADDDEPQRLPAAFAPVTLAIEPENPDLPAPEPEPPPAPAPPPEPVVARPAPAPLPRPEPPPTRAEPIPTRVEPPPTRVEPVPTRAQPMPTRVEPMAVPSEAPAELRHIPRPIPSTIMVKPIGDGTRRRR